jgi:signal transduction histidine kinase
MRLLAQVVAEFHEGKRREGALRRNAYLQAVHETGARLTHDVKNLLQSLYALVAMAPREPGPGYEGLLQRQLPQLTKRLNATIEQLRAPEIPVRVIEVSACSWWEDLERRLADSGVALTRRIEGDATVPAAVFDTFVENALDNARAKREREGALEISIDFQCIAAYAEISVRDTGSAVPDDIAARLFREPIERGAGLGIGLYNVARQAAAAGYRIHLACNDAGDVRFALAREPV